MLWGAAFGAAVMGCSAAEPGPAAPPTAGPLLSVSQVCAGLFTDDGGKALERILESTEFQIRDEKRNPEVGVVARAMEDAYRSGAKIHYAPQPVCRIVGMGKAGYRPTANVMFTAYSKYDADPADLPGVTARRPRVWMQGKSVDVTFDCVSVRVGSTPDVPLQVTTAFQEQWQASKGAAVLGQDYLAVTHSAALAVAKVLGCVNDGGLPARAQELPPPAVDADAGSAPNESPAP
ncbi:hypothetical protein ABZW32_30630 [Streptomyces sp. NPDC004667]|uniref:hypothetical protein n=1 Tax=Streptomyces sp. NPDC004667 TaxID=3154285 RepID=UPI00339FC304